MSWILTFVAIGAAAAAWFTPRSDVDADLAADVALSALDTAGIDDADVVGSPTRGVYRARVEPVAAPDTSAPSAEDTAEPELGPEVPVWVVVVSLDGAEIEMNIDDEKGQLVYVDDLIGKDRSERALTEEQWNDVAVYRDDHRDRWVERNITGSAAAAAIVGVGFVIARRGGTDRA